MALAVEPINCHPFQKIYFKGNRKMENKEKLSEVVEKVCAMARYGIRKLPAPDNEMIERVSLIEDKLIPILADLEAVEN